MAPMSLPLVVVLCGAAFVACDAPLDASSLDLKDAGREPPDTTEATDPQEMEDTDASPEETPEGDDESDPDVVDEPVETPVEPEPVEPEEDAGAGDASEAPGNTDPGKPPVISAPAEVVRALCSNAYDSVRLAYSTVTRGSWQFNPGGSFTKLTAPGYPCRAFLEEQKTRPKIDDLQWSDAPDGAFLGFSEPSSISATDYTDAQFRYFRSFIFVPEGANLTSLSVKAMGIDDSVYLELTNSRYPNGISPTDVGPSDPAVGACQGNDHGAWNLAKYVAEGEINVLLLVHADLAAATSTLVSVDVRADDAPIQLVSCKK